MGDHVVPTALSTLSTLSAAPVAGRSGCASGLADHVVDDPIHRIDGPPATPIRPDRKRSEPRGLHRYAIERPVVLQRPDRIHGHAGADIRFWSEDAVLHHARDQASDLLAHVHGTASLAPVTGRQHMLAHDFSVERHVVLAERLVDDRVERQVRLAVHAKDARRLHDAVGRLVLERRERHEPFAHELVNQVGVEHGATVLAGDPIEDDVAVLVVQPRHQTVEVRHPLPEVAEPVPSGTWRQVLAVVRAGRRHGRPIKFRFVAVRVHK